MDNNVKAEVPVLVFSRIRENIKAHGLQLGSDYTPKLEEKIKVLIGESAIRAKNNNRKTIMAKDL